MYFIYYIPSYINTRCASQIIIFERQTNSFEFRSDDFPNIPPFLTDNRSKKKYLSHDNIAYWVGTI